MDVRERPALLDDLTKNDLGVFFVLFFLFIAGFLIFAGVMILVVLKWYLALLFLLAPITGVAIEVSEKWILKIDNDGPIGGIRNETKEWAIILGWCLPRKHREAIMGDILEDCQEMRKKGLPERKIRTHTLWQWVISVITLAPTFIFSAIGRLLGAK
jgi:hypothetical protein